MSGFYMRVLASDHVFYQGRVEAVTLPGDDGERTVLAHHADSIISIREGELRFRDVEENWHEAIVGLGFAEMINNRLTILVDTAERPEDIDRKKRKQELRSSFVRSRVCRNTTCPKHPSPVR